MKATTEVSDLAAYKTRSRWNAEPGADGALRRSYASRMLAAWPLSAKNLGRAAQSLLRDMTGR